jgi:hypothetical protein
VIRLRYRLLAVAAFLLAFPFFLRRRPRVERRIAILAPPSAIFPFVDDLRNWMLWTSWNQREEIHYTYGELAAGEGAEQRWRGARMSGVLRIVKSERDSGVDYELTMDGHRQRFFGRISLQLEGARTVVTWKCVWDLAENPYRRYIDLLMRWMMGRDLAAGLENLKQVVERAVNAYADKV